MEQQNRESNDEINLYDLWKVIVKRKKVFIGIFLLPLVIAIIISLIIPRYYRGEGEVTNPVIPAPNIVSLIGNIDDAKKVTIFANNSDAIKSVLVSLPKKSTDKVSIIIDAKTEDVIPQAFKDIFVYISNLPEIKGEIVQTDLKIKNLMAAKEANLIYYNYIIDMIKKRQSVVFISVNPSDLLKKDVDLLQEIVTLQRVKGIAGILAPPLITKQPSNTEIKKIFVVTGILSLLMAIFVVFFLDYIERMKARKNK